jgi:hypothetical protein
MDTLKQFNAARRVSVPLIIWKTPDPAATMNAVRDGAEYPVLGWDIVRGVRPWNEAAKGKTESECGVGDPVGMLQAVETLPADSVMFMQNAQLYAGGDNPNPSVLQAIWNLRDTNKADHKTLVLLSPQMRTPLELANDIMVLDETLPDDKALSNIVVTQAEHARIGAKDAGVKFKAMTAADVDKAVDALSGLSAFAAEQTVAVSFEKNGDGVTLNQNTLWDRKRQAIEETKGLKVWRDGETLDDVKGCENVKDFIHKVITGRMPPRGIVFIDEIEKQLGGVTGDLSGATTDQLGVLLVKMQNMKAQGMMFVGHAGSAKSMVAKATGNTAGIVTMEMDLGAMKGNLVGESEANIRAAFKVVEAVTQGRALFIATCNKINGNLPPELKRRFTLGTFFFDLPTLAEREAIWAYYITKFGLKGKGFIENGSGGYRIAGLDDTGWTGADIFNCCNRAWMFNCTIAEAGKYATPICKTDPQAIETLRGIADNAFISANYEGLYRKEKQTVDIGGSGKARKMSFK